MAQTIDVVEFEIGGALYALDIQLAREIVEMMPITSVPRAAAHVAGIINLRGEITNIINLQTLLCITRRDVPDHQKIIVLIPEAAGGANVGIIVDDVHSVISVPEENIEQIDGSISNEAAIKGIIKMRGADSAAKKEAGKLVIWLDIRRMLQVPAGS